MAAQAWNNIERLGDIEEQREADRLAREEAQQEARDALIERYQRDIYLHGPDLAEALRLHATDDLGEEIRKLANGDQATSEDPLGGLKETLREVVDAYAQELADDDLREDG